MQLKFLATMALMVGLLAACSQPNPEAEAALAEKKAHAAKHAMVDSVAKAWMAAITPELAKPLYADDAMMYNPDAPNGKKASEMLANMAENMKAFKDWKMESRVTKVGDDYFAIAGTMSAKYTGPSNYMDPKSKVITDAEVGGPWVAIVLLNDAGKVTAEHMQWDGAAMMMQMQAAAKKK